MSSPNFRIKYDLGDEFSEIGTYYDIVYKGGNETHFEVGYERNGVLTKIILKPRNNRPVIHRLYVRVGFIDFEFLFEDKVVRFKHVSGFKLNQNLAEWIIQLENKFDSVAASTSTAINVEGVPFSTGIYLLAENINGEVHNSGFVSKKDSKANLMAGLTQAFDSPLLPFFTWMDPVRAEPRRLYDEYSSAYSSSGSHAPYLLKKMLSSKNKKNEFRIGEFLKFGKQSGLFAEIVPKVFDKKDDSSPFELLIAIGKKTVKMNHVGYGVSQVLPLVVEIMNMKNDSWMSIQQPEVHLHPRAQAAFGDFVFAFAQTHDKNFVVETHSDFLIDRFRLAMNKAKSSRKKTMVQAQVCFFERTLGGNRITMIPILPDGSYSSEQTDGFRDFFLKEQLELLSM